MASFSSVTSLEISGPLRTALADLYFREECRQKGWAFASLASIYADVSSRSGEAVLSFMFGDQDIKVKMMQQVIPEVIEICQPVDGEKRGFLFSYLVCKIGKLPLGTPVVANPAALCWVQFRAGARLFSERQVEALSRIRLPLALFAIRDVLAPPRSIETRWETRSGSEWLDLLDELKEQAEYDDEYF
jgi:hypothetical protein